MGVISIILPNLRKVCPQTWKLVTLFQIWTQFSHIESGECTILSGRLNLVGVQIGRLYDVKGLDLDISPVSVGSDLIVLLLTWVILEWVQ